MALEQRGEKREPEFNTTHNLKPTAVPKKNEVVVKTEPEPVIAELVRLATALRPSAFFGRVDYWCSGAGGSSWGEYVTGSSEPLIPVTQPTDNQGHATGPPMLKDKLDREILTAKREFRDDIEAARRRLAHANALQQKYLFDFHVGTADLNDLVTDSPVCRKCKGTKEMWVRAKRKSPWRIKAGLGPCCYSAWRAAGAPDLPPVDARTMDEAYGKGKTA